MRWQYRAEHTDGCDESSSELHLSHCVRCGPSRKAQQEDEAIVAVEDEVSSLKQETPVAV